MGSQTLAKLDASQKAASAPGPVSALERRPLKPHRKPSPPDSSRLSPPITQIPIFPTSALNTSPTPPSLPPLPLQRKLTIGSVDDPLEHEADRVADRVMRMPDPASAAIDSGMAKSAPQRAGGSEAEPGQRLQTDLNAWAAPEFSGRPENMSDARIVAVGVLE